MDEHDVHRRFPIQKYQDIKSRMTLFLAEIKINSFWILKERLIRGEKLSIYLFIVIIKSIYYISYDVYHP